MAPLKSALLSYLALRGSAPDAQREYWGGWDGIQHAFIFGDSYTQTNFDPKSTQPSVDNPLGNPAYPGVTSSNGPNWVDYLTTTYNSSSLLTYNFAYGGATVDAALVPPTPSTIISVKDQIETEFLPLYTGRRPKVAWTGADSIFAIWVGINDINLSFQNGTDYTTRLNARIFREYLRLVNELYHAGGRNFVFLNVPPFDRSPRGVAFGSANSTLLKQDIASWNHQLVSTARYFKASKLGRANVWVYDTNSVFDQALYDPTSYPQTAGLKNTTDYCTAYGGGTTAVDTYLPECGIPVNEYFWLNQLHPTYPIHEVVAQGISEAVAAGPNI